jgi:hypothetical protein
LSQQNKDGGDQALHYCQLRIPSDAIKMLAETKGHISNTYFEAMKEIKEKDAYILAIRMLVETKGHIPNNYFETFK